MNHSHFIFECVQNSAVKKCMYKLNVLSFTSGIIVPMHGMILVQDAGTVAVNWTLDFYLQGLMCQFLIKI